MKFAFLFSLFAGTALSLFSSGCSALRIEPDAAPWPRIAWKPGTLRLLQESGNGARMIRLSSSIILCAFDLHHKIWVRRSEDNGATWSEPIEVAASPGALLTNADLLELRNGGVLCLFNERPLQGPGKPKRPYAVRASRSASDGVGWQAAQTLFEAGTDPKNGCWEPVGLQLPSGEVQVYFANEAPYAQSGEQEISLMRSKDGGRSWTPPERIIYRPNARDGMPSPLLLHGSRTIAVAFEDNGYHGNFKPMIARMPLRSNWRKGWVDGASKQREPALRQPLFTEVYAGAPWLRQMPSGWTVLSYQQHDEGDMARSRMVVCVGDKQARRFSSPSYPFPLTAGVGQLWNSVFVKDERTVTALSSTIIDGVHGVWAVEGELVECGALSIW